MKKYLLDLIPASDQIKTVRKEKPKRKLTMKELFEIAETQNLKRVGSRWERKRK